MTLRPFISLIACAALSMTTAWAQELPTFYGLNASGLTSGTIYSIEAGEQPTCTQLVTTGFSSLGGGVYVNGSYYAMLNLQAGTRSYKYMYVYSADTWHATGTVSLPSTLRPITMTYNTVDHTTYGCVADEEGEQFSFCSINLTNGQATTIAALPQRIVAMAADGDGHIWAIGVDGKLNAVDASTGALTAVGATGFVPNEGLQDACYDYNTNTLYWLGRNDDESLIMSVNTSTGVATRIKTFENADMGWTGVFTRTGEQQEPGMVNRMHVSFDGPALKGRISFDLPVTASNGAPISGMLGYEVSVDGTIVAEGQLGAGEHVETDVEVTEGMHSFAVRALKNGVPGINSTDTRFVGHDSVALPQWAKATKNAESEAVTVSWAPVTVGAHGGYIDLSNLRYTVTRVNDGAVVASATAATEICDTTIPQYDIYTYSVTVSDGHSTTDEGITTNACTAGASIGVIPPYYYDFLDGAGFGLFTTVDANGDGYTWISNSTNVYYTRNTDAAADDWLMSPQILMERGKMYNFTVAMIPGKAQERFEIKMGTSPEPQAMTTVVVEPTELTNVVYIDCWITAETTGLHYIGIHAISDANSDGLAVARFSLGQGIASASPSKVTDLTATPDQTGAMAAEIAFTCPTTTFAGEELTSIAKAYIVNQTTNQIVATVNNPTPGQRVSGIRDNAAVAGFNIYSVACENEAGLASPESESCWVGIDTPASPTDASWMQVGNSTVINWSAPQAGVHGGWINPDELTYMVMNLSTREVVANGLRECTYTDTPSTGDKQQTALYYGIYAINSEGQSFTCLTNYSAFGTPYATPYHESFSYEGLDTMPWISNPISGYNSWNTQWYSSDPSLTSQDNDYGMLVCTPVGEGISLIQSPTVDISALSRPMLSFWYGIFDGFSTVEVKASTDCGNTWSNIASLNKVDTDDWYLANVDLSAFKGEKRLQIAFEVKSVYSGKDVIFDNISISNLCDTDLLLANLRVAKYARTGNDASCSVMVINNGVLPVESYSLTVTANGRPAGTIEGSTLQPGKSTTHKFTAHVPANASALDVEVTLICAADQNASNNSVMASAAVEVSPFARPTDLSAVANGEESITLQWTAPDGAYNPTVHDDLESYDTWSIGGIDVVRDEATGQMVVTQDHGQIGDYLLIDNDHQPTTYTWGMFGSGAEHLGDGMVCQVFDASLYMANTSIIAAHSGNKMLCFWASSQNDDYLILPELSAHNKYISLWAKSMSERYGLESFDVMISRTGTEVADFETFMSVTEVRAGYKDQPDAGYTFYEFDLPEDTKYAAIRYNSAGSLALLIDDITYTPANVFETIEVRGFNVYRNDELVNAAPVTATQYIDVPSTSGLYCYNVTALYDLGESGYSDEAAVDFIASVSDTMTDGLVTITTDGLKVTVSGSEGSMIAIYTPDGRLVRLSEGGPEPTSFTLTAGAWLIKVGNTSQMIVLK